MKLYIPKTYFFDLKENEEFILHKLAKPDTIKTVSLCCPICSEQHLTLPAGACRTSCHPDLEVSMFNMWQDSWVDVAYDKWQDEAANQIFRIITMIQNLDYPDKLSRYNNFVLKKDMGNMCRVSTVNMVGKGQTPTDQFDLLVDRYLKMNAFW